MSLKSLFLAALIAPAICLTGCGGDDSNNVPPDDFDLGVVLAEITAVNGTSGDIEILFSAVGDGPLVVTLRYSTDGGTSFSLITPQPMPRDSRNPTSVPREGFDVPFDWNSPADIAGMAQVILQLEVVDQDGVLYGTFGPVTVDNTPTPTAIGIEDPIGVIQPAAPSRLGVPTRASEEPAKASDKR